jgi:hypothetical protein
MFITSAPRSTFASAPVLAEPRLTFGAGGLCDGTLVDTARGWMPVERLAPGDRVQTLDGGLRPLAAVIRRSVDSVAGGPRAAHLIEVPGGVLDTCSDLAVLAESRLLLDLPEAEARHGSPLVLAPAAALEGWCGIRKAAARGRSGAVTLVFEDEEVIFAQTGALVHCPAPGAEGAVPGLAEASGFFVTLDWRQTRDLLNLPAHVRPEALPQRAGRAGLRLVHAA